MWLCLLFYISSVVVVEGLEVRLYSGTSGRVISLIVGREPDYFLWQRAGMLVDKPATGGEVEGMGRNTLFMSFTCPMKNP